MQTEIGCIGIILDGNRRWAKERGVPTLEGHREGMERLHEATRWVAARGIPHLVVYAFSTENWKRTAEEVSYLMVLIEEGVRRFTEEAIREGVRVRIAGQRERFSPRLRAAIEQMEADTAHNTKITVWMCLSYGGRAEIAAAAQAAAAQGEVTEESLENNLWTAGMPDPDLIVRTGGAHRLSNFLLWQSAYSELFFIDEFWPDFSEVILDRVLAEYKERERRFGT